MSADDVQAWSLLPTLCAASFMSKSWLGKCGCATVVYVRVLEYGSGVDLERPSQRRTSAQPSKAIAQICIVSLKRCRR